MQEHELEALWDDWHQRVLAYALRRTDPASAEEAVAETFVIAWRRLDEPPRQPLPWLLAVARRVLANQRRSDSRRVALAERLRAEADAPGSPDDAGDPRVLGALASLGERDREALLLHAWEGLANDEAATVLGCSSNAFAVRLHRARTRFAAALETAQVTS